MVHYLTFTSSHHKIISPVYYLTCTFPVPFPIPSIFSSLIHVLFWLIHTHQMHYLISQDIPDNIISQCISPVHNLTCTFPVLFPTPRMFPSLIHFTKMYSPGSSILINCMISPIKAFKITLSHTLSHLNISSAIPNPQYISFFDPFHRGDILFWLIHSHQLDDLPG